VQFTATLEQARKTATGFVVPEEVVDALGGGKRPKVTVTVAGHSYASSIASMGGRYMLPVSAENRAATGLSAGDEATVEVVLDTAPRELVVPDDLAAALDADPAARAFFDGLSYSERRWFTLQVEGAKKAETRQRRVATLTERLASGRGAR
jgi:hypothetical protein